VQRKVAGHFAVRRDMPLDDAAARQYPVVRGLDYFFEIVVGQHPVGKIAAGTDDP
jgi:hypothetical protein